MNIRNKVYNALKTFILKSLKLYLIIIKNTTNMNIYTIHINKIKILLKTQTMKENIMERNK